jgi:hypothetical protein
MEKEFQFQSREFFGNFVYLLQFIIQIFFKMLEAREDLSKEESPKGSAMRSRTEMSKTIE